MKGIIRRSIKFLILFLLTCSSVFALYMYAVGDFDPVELAIQLKNEGKRDQALDVIQHALENGIGKQSELKTLQKEYEYGVFEKSKDLAYHGAIQGEVFNFYSGLGCIAADLCVYGDIRDLTKQGYYYLTDQDVDKIVVALSGIGVVTTAAEMTGAGAIVDAGVSVTKTAVKYINKVLRHTPQGLLKLLKKGKSFKPDDYKKFWSIFKESGFSLPNFTEVISHVKNVRYLDTATDLVKSAKKGAIIFISKSGEAGLKTYDYFKKVGLGKTFIKCVRRNPKAALGITKFHTVLHGLKIVKKNGPIIVILVGLYGLASFLLMIGGPWLPGIVLTGSLIYTGWCLMKVKSKRQSKNEYRVTGKVNMENSNSGCIQA